MKRPPRWTVFLAAACLAPLCAAQSSEFELSPDGDWSQTQSPEPGSDQAVFAEAQALIAQGDPGKAASRLTKWIEANKRTRNANIALGYYLRGVARLENGSDQKALIDFETVIVQHADTPYYARAIEQEIRIADLYLGGLRRKVLGLRIESGRTIGEEILIRTQERLPGSKTAEAAALKLADHYYGRRRLELAAEMYEIFRLNFPESEHRRYAMLREIQANIARFKGPRYDASGLIDAKLLIERYAEQYPAESIRTGITDGFLGWLDESAATQALQTAKWYLKTDDEPSARFVLARMIRRHPATVAADEGLGIMLDRGWIVTRDDEQTAAPQSPAGRPDENADEDPAP